MFTCNVKNLNKTIMKKVLLLLCLLLPLDIYADSVKVGDLWYNLNPEDNTAELTSNGDDFPIEIVIPETVVYDNVTYSVTSIKGYSFMHGNITSVKVGKNVKTIGDWAFWGCPITSLDIPEGVISIGGCAFYGCYIKSLLLPNSLKDIGTYAFYGSSNLESLTIPANLSSIEEFAFGNCPLVSISVDKNNTSYDSRNNCNAIIRTENSTLILGCKNTIIPEGVSAIQNNSFHSCKDLLSINIPSSVLKIGNNTFENCTNLKYLYASEGLQEIGDNAFKSCFNLSKINLPSTLISIGEGAFCYCPNLISVVSQIQLPFAVLDNSFCSGWQIIDGNVIINPTAAVLYVPSGTKENYQNSGWNNFVSIVEGAPKEVTIDGYTYSYSLEERVAYVIPDDYQQLDKVEIPSSIFIEGTQYRVKGISKGTFTYGEMTSVVIDSGIETIAPYAFFNCMHLKELKLPASLKMIGNSAFEACLEITNIVSEAITPVDITDDVFSDDIYSKATLKVPYGSKTNYQEAKNWTKFVNIEEMPAYDKGFYFRIQNNEAEIVSGSIRYSGEIVIPEIVKFNNVEYPVTSISKGAFWGCEDIVALHIPSSVTSIAVGSFVLCSNLASIVVDENNSIYDSRDNCNAIVETATNTLISGCMNTSIPNDIVVIGDCAFEGQLQLKSITIPNGVTTIGGRAFRGVSFTSLEIPGSVTSIGKGAFEDCDKLTSLIVKIPTPLSVDQYTFWFDQKQTTLYVPSGSESLYGVADYWKDFKEIKAIEDPDEFSLNFMGQTIKDGATLLINAEGWSGLGSIYTDTGDNTKNGLFIFISKGGKVSGNYSLEIINNTLNGDLKWSMGGETYALNEVTKLEKTFSTDENGIASVKFSAENIPSEGSLEAKLTVSIGEKTKTFYIKIDFKKKESPDLTVSGKVGEPVDLGLSVKWASWNVGAGAPEEYGNHYAWGELEPKADYSASTYNFYNNGYTKYGSIDNKYELDEADDVARQKWGEDWRMPTFDELKELYEKCSFSNETYNGVPVTKVIGPNGNYIYMSGPGNFTGQTLYFKNTVGSYWSRNLETDSYAKDLDFFTSYRSLNGDTRYHGQSVRPVYAKIVSGKAGEPVDLGLTSGTLWSSCNIGASTPEEYGSYFAWGETAPKSNYDWSTYKFGGGSNFTKYNSSDGLTELALEDDAAYVLWGENWRMPTHQQELELVNECSWESTTLNGISGYKITGPNGNSIFMPRGGLYDGTDYDADGTTISSVNTGGWYWSSTLNTVGSSYAQGLCFFPSLISNVSDHERCDGHNIRPVYAGGISKRIVHVTEAGTLPTLISEAEKYLIEDLTITGELNGTDFRLLRDMAGNNYKGEVTEGKLKVLDLSGVSIVEGGDSYLDAQNIRYSYKRGSGIMSSGSGIYYTSKDMFSCYMFAGCCVLQSIKLPAEVSTIEETAFASCNYLTSVVIPDKVTTIKGRPFDKCDALSSIIVESGNTVYDSRDNCNAIIETSTNTLITGCKGTIIPNSVTSIGDEAFMGCGLTTIDLSSNITSIGKRAFSYCEDLESLSLPKNVTFIGESAFSGCWSLTSISVDSENAKYDSRDNCNAIIETVTNTLVAGCTNTVIPESVTTIGKHGMEQRGITTFTIPGNVETIEEDGFQNCYRLVSLVISEGVKTIGSWGFANCVLQNLILPSTIEYIGSWAFVSNKFSSVTIYAEDVPQTGVDAFEHSNLDNATLYVPYGTKSKYEQADGWKEFKNIVEMGETTPIIISSAKQVTYMSDKNLDFTGYPDLKAYVATGYDKSSGTIWLTRVKEVPANTGFLLMGEANTYEIPAKSGESTSYYMNLFKGTIEGTTIYTTDGDYTNYYLSNGDAGVGFYKVTKTEGVALAANRAYLSVPTEIPTVGSEGSTETIKVSSAGQVPYYNSQSLDFSSLDAQGVKAYTATGYDYTSGTIWLTRVKQVPAETGILIMAPEGEYPVPTASISSVYANMFRGTLEGTTIQTHEVIDGKDYINYYLSSGDAGVGFYRVAKEEGVTIGTNRCYLPILNKDAAAGTRSANSDLDQIAFRESDEVIGIQLLRGIGGDDDGTTSIKDLTPALSEGEGAWYTLQGQRVAKPGKGIYIKNGKKVVIK